MTYRNPDTKKSEKSWVSVTDISSRTRIKEAERTKYTSVDELFKFTKRDKNLRNLYLELSREERLSNLFEMAGYSVQLNPTPDGNCQFTAIADQLRVHNIAVLTPLEVREATVNYIIEYRRSPFNERQDFGEIIDTTRYSSFEDYVNRMRQHTTFGDHLTLQAIISELYFVRINVISSEGDGHNRIIEPQEDVNQLPTLSVGYDPETLHYVSVSEVVDFQRHGLSDGSLVREDLNLQDGSEIDGLQNGSDLMRGEVSMQEIDEDMIEGDDEFVFGAGSIDVGDLSGGGDERVLPSGDGLVEDVGDLKSCTGKAGVGAPGKRRSASEAANLIHVLFVF